MSEPAVGVNEIVQLGPYTTVRTAQLPARDFEQRRCAGDAQVSHAPDERAVDRGDLSIAAAADGEEASVFLENDPHHRAPGTVDKRLSRGTDSREGEVWSYTECGHRVLLESVNVSFDYPHSASRKGRCLPVYTPHFTTFPAPKSTKNRY